MIHFLIVSLVATETLVYCCCGSAVLLYGYATVILPPLCCIGYAMVLLLCSDVTTVLHLLPFAVMFGCSMRSQDLCHVQVCHMLHCSLCCLGPVRQPITNSYTLCNSSSCNFSLKVNFYPCYGFLARWGLSSSPIWRGMSSTSLGSISS